MLAYLLQTAFLALMAFILGGYIGLFLFHFFGRRQSVGVAGEIAEKEPQASQPVAQLHPQTAAQATVPSKRREHQAATPQTALTPQAPDLSTPPLGDELSEPDEASLSNPPIGPTAPDTSEPDSMISGSEAETAPEFDEDQPVGEERPAGGIPDDLKRVRGIGPKFEQQLNLIGIWHYRQIAGWTSAEADWVSRYLGFPGKVIQDDWIGQVNILAAGVDTEYSRKFDRENEQIP